MDVSPRGFEPRRMHAFLLDGSPVDTAQRGHRVRVVKELVLKANGLCPREFESRRFFFCLFLGSHVHIPRSAMES